MARLTFLLLLENGKVSCLQREGFFANLEVVREVVYAAGLLHDLARGRAYLTGRDHALLSAEYAEEILKRAGFILREISIITEAIREHRGKEVNPSLLGEYLHRADLASRWCWCCPAKATCTKWQEGRTSPDWC